MDLVDCPYGVKLDEEVSLDSTKETERVEQDEKKTRPFMKLEGVGIVVHIQDLIWTYYGGNGKCLL